MTVYDNEAGTNGAAATTTTTGASGISPGASPGAITHDAAMAIAGSLGLKIVCNSTEVSIVEYTSFTAGTQLEFRFGYKLPATAFTADTTIFQWYGGVGGTVNVGRLKLNAANSLRAQDNASAHTGTIVSDMTAYLGTYIGIGILCDVGSSSITGDVKVRVYSSPTAAVGTFIGTEFHGTGYDFGGPNNVIRARVGIATVQTASRTVGVDNLEIATGTTFLGPPATSTAPTANAGVSQYPVAGSTITLHGEASTAGTGSITGYAWTCTEYPPGAPSPSISNPAAATPTVKLDSANGHYVFHLVVTQSGGSLTASADVTEYPYPLSGADVLVYAVGATPFTNEGGAATLRDALNDASLVTKALSPANPIAAVLPVTMCPFPPGANSILIEGNFSVAGVNRTVNIKKEDGTTLLMTTTYALTSVEVEHEVAWDAPTLAAIPAQADRRALIVEVSDTTA